MCTKALDKMNHFSLYIKLMNINVHRSFLDVLMCRYSKFYAFVQWGTATRQLAGVRESGVLSLTGSAQAQ